MIYFRTGILLLVVALIASLITACSNNPSDEELRTQVTAYLLKDYRSKLYTVENFQKVNGFENDVRTYTAHIQYDLVFKVDLQDAHRYLNDDSNNSFLKKSSDALGLL